MYNQQELQLIFVKYRELSSCFVLFYSKLFSVIQVLHNQISNICPDNNNNTFCVCSHSQHLKDNWKYLSGRGRGRLQLDGGEEQQSTGVINRVHLPK